MTNIEIFRVFLKKYRIYSAYKRAISDYNNQEIELGSLIGGIFLWTRTETKVKWEKVDAKWDRLCDEFDLTGTVDLRKL